MATLVNKKNREVKVIIPNMREFTTFYSDNDGVIGMLFKSDWEEERQEEHWKPSEEQIRTLDIVISDYRHACTEGSDKKAEILKPLLEQIRKL